MHGQVSPPKPNLASLAQSAQKGTQRPPAWETRAARLFPAGSNGEFDLPPELGLVIDHGQGCYLWDASGRQFLDFSMGWGSALPGHARPEISAAISAQLERGLNFAFLTQPAVQLAERIQQLSPAAERIRFCASGTEANAYIQRLARAYTGKPLLMKFEGAYHGANELGLVSLFPATSADYPVGVPSSAGLPGDTSTYCAVAPFNDLDEVTRLVEQVSDALAGIVVEPLHRCLPPLPGFLPGLRDLANKHGCLLLFDEVVTGFRLALGGAQAYYGVTPDLVAYGKALGGGTALGAFGGKASVMDLVREDRLGQANYVWTASSLGGNPLACSAALAAIDIYSRPETYPHLHGLGSYLRQRMQATVDALQAPASILGDGPLAQIVFATPRPIDQRGMLRAIPGLGRKLMLELFRGGIFLNPMGTKLYLSLAHTRETCDAFMEVFERSLKTVLAGHGV